MDYKAIVGQVANENKSGYLPPLKTKIDNIENYDVVFVGFPTWECNFQTVKELCENSKVLEGFELKGGERWGGAMEGDKKLNAIIEVKKRLQKTKMS